jgi:hypothetical protein
MHDHLTGVMFRVSASNVQTDAVLFNDTWDDWSWNAVWDSTCPLMKTAGRSRCAFPLSQLRFTSDDKQTWGINVERYIRRRNEGRGWKWCRRKRLAAPHAWCTSPVSMDSNRRADWNCCRTQPVAPSTSRQRLP